MIEFSKLVIKTIWYITAFLMIIYLIYFMVGQSKELENYQIYEIQDEFYEQHDRDLIKEEAEIKDILDIGLPAICTKTASCFFYNKEFDDDN